MVQKRNSTSLEVDRGVWGAEPPRLTAGLFINVIWNGTERNIWNGTGWNGYVYGTFGSGTGWNGCASGTAGPARVPEKLLLERNGTEYLERNGLERICLWNVWLWNGLERLCLWNGWPGTRSRKVAFGTERNGLERQFPAFHGTRCPSIRFHGTARHCTEGS